MTPTQAQIYAAAGAINDALDYEWGPDEWVCSIAKAALTAAAEVAPKLNNLIDDPNSASGKRIDTAAAEVDTRSASELADVLTVMERRDRNATIERCAQVAGNKAAELEAWSHQDNASRLAAEVLRKVEAAIRALGTEGK